MPIGFWAISRKEVKAMLQARSGANPSRGFLAYVIEELETELQKTLDNVIDTAGHELYEEVNKL